MVVIMVVVVIIMPIAAVPYILEFVAAFFGLSAVFAMLLDGHP